MKRLAMTVVAFGVLLAIPPCQSQVAWLVKAMQEVNAANKLYRVAKTAETGARVAAEASAALKVATATKVVSKELELAKAAGNTAAFGQASESLGVLINAQGRTTRNIKWEPIQKGIDDTADMIIKTDNIEKALKDLGGFSGGPGPSVPSAGRQPLPKASPNVVADIRAVIRSHFQLMVDGKLHDAYEQLSPNWQHGQDENAFESGYISTPFHTIPSETPDDDIVVTFSLNDRLLVLTYMKKLTGDNRFMLFQMVKTNGSWQFDSGKWLS